MKISKRISKISLLFITLFILIGVFLFTKWLSPQGSFSCQKSYGANYFLSLLKPSCLDEPSPKERYSYNSKGELIVLADPLYLSVFSPRPFQEIELEIIYRPEIDENTAIFEAGFLADAKLWRYQLRPVYNHYLEKILSDWSFTAASDLSLWQKDRKYNSLGEFTTDLKDDEKEICPNMACLALYNINENIIPAKKNKISLDIALDEKGDGGAKADNVSKLVYPLRGAHQLYFYLNQEKLDISGSFIDLNDNRDLDDLELIVYRGSEVVANLKIDDRRKETELGAEISEAIFFNLQEDDLSPGLYKLEIRVNDDLVIKELEINSSYLNIANKIWPYTNSPSRVYTDASYIQVKALSPAALQTLRFNESDLELSQIYKQYELESSASGINRIDLTNGGLIIENNGVFSFTEAGLNNPKYKNLDRFSFKDSQLKYILATYDKAERLESGWYRSTLSFRGSDLYRENNHYNLILSIPGLTLDSHSDNSVTIKQIKVKYSGPSLLQKIRSMIFKLNI